MFGLIAFVVTCLAWQSVKNSWRKKHVVPTVRFGRLEDNQFAPAPCGCRVDGDRVSKRCAAHDALLHALRDA